MVAELLKNRDLSANRDHLTEDFHLRCAALDDKAARAGCLESNEQNQISGIGQALRQVVKNAASGRHAAGGNDDTRKTRVVDLL